MEGSFRSLLTLQDTPCSPSTVFQKTLGACSQNVQSSVVREKQACVPLVQPAHVGAGGPRAADPGLGGLTGSFRTMLPLQKEIF